MKSIAILYIALGKYDIFWPEFYESCEKHFCMGVNKHYFVFTDSDQIKTNKNITAIFQDDLGWPFSTLYRYKMFDRIKQTLGKFDYIVYLNGNCQFVSAVTLDEFFGTYPESLVACIHPGYHDANPSAFTTERRFISSAYIKNPKKYYAGGINGGSSAVFLQALPSLNQLIESDLQRGVLAVWHDESYWNAFLNNYQEIVGNYLHELDPGYLFPDQWSLPFSMKIKLRNKSDYFDVDGVKPIVKPKKLSFFEKLSKKFS